MRAESADHRSAGLSVGLDVRRSSGTWWDDDCVGWRIRPFAAADRGWAARWRWRRWPAQGRPSRPWCRGASPPIPRSPRCAPPPPCGVWRRPIVPVPPSRPGRPVRRPRASGWQPPHDRGADGQAAAQVGPFNLALAEPASRVRHLDAAPTGQDHYQPEADTRLTQGRQGAHVSRHPPGRSSRPGSKPTAASWSRVSLRMGAPGTARPSGPGRKISLASCVVWLMTVPAWAVGLPRWGVVLECLAHGLAAVMGMGSPSGSGVGRTAGTVQALLVRGYRIA